MYRLAISRQFIAQHYLIGGDWGDENQLHSHHYRVEALLEGAELDKHGYLVDIVDLDKALSSIVGSFRDRVLNDQAVFAGLNPSLERFARIIHDQLREQLDLTGLRLQISVWENETDFAGFAC